LSESEHSYSEELAGVADFLCIDRFVSTCFKFYVVELGRWMNFQAAYVEKSNSEKIDGSIWIGSEVYIDRVSIDAEQSQARPASDKHVLPKKTGYNKRVRC
jgi:hypothetical protein